MSAFISSKSPDTHDGIKFDQSRDIAVRYVGLMHNAHLEFSAAELKRLSDAADCHPTEAFIGMTEAFAILLSGSMSTLPLMPGANPADAAAEIGAFFTSSLIKNCNLLHKAGIAK